MGGNMLAVVKIYEHTFQVGQAVHVHSRDEAYDTAEEIILSEYEAQGLSVWGDTRMIGEIQRDLKNDNYYMLCLLAAEPGKNVAVQIVEIKEALVTIATLKKRNAIAEARRLSKKEPFIVQQCGDSQNFSDEFFRALCAYVSPCRSYSVCYRDGQSIDGVGVYPYLAKSGELMVILTKNGTRNDVFCRTIASITAIGRDDDCP
jgi:hypothetical protein